MSDLLKRINEIFGRLVRDRDEQALRDHEQLQKTIKATKVTESRPVLLSYPADKCTWEAGTACGPKREPPEQPPPRAKGEK